ncbi:MAG: hypothetical protein SaTV1_gp1 [Sanya totivirus 1]|nr:MAG: hypothetical protein SaTV1_gp1 [Sanya totivirus 1]
MSGEKSRHTPSRSGLPTTAVCKGQTALWPPREGLKVAEVSGERSRNPRSLVRQQVIPKTTVKPPKVVCTPKGRNEDQEESYIQTEEERRAMNERVQRFIDARASKIMSEVKDISTSDDLGSIVQMKILGQTVYTTEHADGLDYHKREGSRRDVSTLGVGMSNALWGLFGKRRDAKKKDEDEEPEKGLSTPLPEEENSPQGQDKPLIASEDEVEEEKGTIPLKESKDIRVAPVEEASEEESSIVEETEEPVPCEVLTQTPPTIPEPTAEDKGRHLLRRYGLDGLQDPFTTPIGNSEVTFQYPGTETLYTLLSGTPNNREYTTHDNRVGAEGDKIYQELVDDEKGAQKPKVPGGTATFVKGKKKNRRPKNKEKYEQRVSEFAAKISTNENSVQSVLRLAEKDSSTGVFYRDVVGKLATVKKITPSLGMILRDAAAIFRAEEQHNTYGSESHVEFANTIIKSDRLLEDLIRNKICPHCLCAVRGFSAGDGWGRYLQTIHNKSQHAANGNTALGGYPMLEESLDARLRHLIGYMGEVQSNGQPDLYPGTQAQERYKEHVGHGILRVDNAYQQIFDALPASGSQLTLTLGGTAELPPRLRDFMSLFPPSHGQDKIPTTDASLEKRTLPRRAKADKQAIEKSSPSDSPSEGLSPPEATYYTGPYTDPGKLTWMVVRERTDCRNTYVLGPNVAEYIDAMETGRSNRYLAARETTGIKMLQNVPGFMDIATAWAKSGVGHIDCDNLKIELYNAQLSREMENRTGYNWLHPIEEKRRTYNTLGWVNGCNFSVCTAEWLCSRVGTGTVPVEQVGDTETTEWVISDSNTVIITLTGNSSAPEEVADSIHLLSRLPYPAFQTIREEVYANPINGLEDNIATIDNAGLVKIGELTPQRVIVMVPNNLHGRVAWLGKDWHVTRGSDTCLRPVTDPTVIEKAIALVTNRIGDIRPLWHDHCLSRGMGAPEWITAGKTAALLRMRFPKQVEIARDTTSRGGSTIHHSRPLDMGERNMLLAQFPGCSFENTITPEDLQHEDCVSAVDQCPGTLTGGGSAYCHTGIRGWNNMAEILVGLRIVELGVTVYRDPHYTSYDDHTRFSTGMRAAFESVKRYWGVGDALVNPLEEDSNWVLDMISSRAEGRGIRQSLESWLDNIQLHWHYNFRDNGVRARTLTGVRTSHLWWQHFGDISVSATLERAQYKSIAERSRCNPGRLVPSDVTFSSDPFGVLPYRYNYDKVWSRIKVEWCTRFGSTGQLPQLTSRLTLPADPRIGIYFDTPSDYASGRSIVWGPGLYQVAAGGGHGAVVSFPYDIITYGGEQGNGSLLQWAEGGSIEPELRSGLLVRDPIPFVGKINMSGHPNSKEAGNCAGGDQTANVAPCISVEQSAVQAGLGLSPSGQSKQSSSVKITPGTSSSPLTESVAPLTVPGAATVTKPGGNPSDAVYNKDHIQVTA